MANAQMEEMSVFRLLGQYNFIVPEIQRDYVWGKDENKQVLEAFLKDIIEKNESISKDFEKSIDAFKHEVDSHIQTENGISVIQQLQNALTEIESKLSMNIGFLYSYRPSYYLNNDSSEDVYLIDGQQRFTTLVLSLMFFALKEDESNANTKCIDEFRRLFKINFIAEKNAFDYRVRAVTHHFLLEMIEKVNDPSDLRTISQKNWFIKVYRNDESIKSILGTIDKLFKTFSKNEIPFFQFILHRVKFWHFKTEETSQGEELYITMNSRGKDLSKNEILRAKLFREVEPEHIMEWGTKWENWQDFFWANKQNNRDADNGFNEFLRWVQILSMISSSKIEATTDDDDSTDKKTITETLKWEKEQYRVLSNRYISLPGIEKYYKAVKYIFETFPKQLQEIKSKYPNYFRPTYITNLWLGPAKRAGLEDIYTITQLDSFRLLPIVEYCSVVFEKGEDVNPQNLYRFCCYLSNLGKQSTVTKGINAACINAVKVANEIASTLGDISQIIGLKKVSTTLLSEEEHFKFAVYCNGTFDRETIEQEFWKAEDLKLNNGKIHHLLKASYFTANSIQQYDRDLPLSKYNNATFDFNNFCLWLKKFIHLNGQSATVISERIWGNLINTSFYSIFPYGAHKCILPYATTDELTLSHIEYLRFVLNTDTTISAKKNIDRREMTFFDNYLDATRLQSEIDIKKQLYIYFVIAYKKDQVFFGNKGKKIGVYENVKYGSSIFTINNQFEHYTERWGGADWRRIFPTTTDSTLFSKLLDKSFWN